MDFSKTLKTVDTVTRVMRKTQLMIKDAPKVNSIFQEYLLERKYKKQHQIKPEPAITISRDRFVKVEL